MINHRSILGFTLACSLLLLSPLSIYGIGKTDSTDSQQNDKSTCIPLKESVTSTPVASLSENKSIRTESTDVQKAQKRPHIHFTKHRYAPWFDAFSNLTS